MMADRRDDNNIILPLVAGVVISAGILALLYKMFFTNKAATKPAAPVTVVKYNQQISAPTECTCARGGKDKFFSQENDRREKQRRREEAALQRAEEAAYEPDPDPEEEYSPLKIAGSTLGILIALLALVLKFVPNETLHDILDIVGLGYLVPLPKPSLCIDPKKQRWPLPPPEPPCCCCQFPYNMK